MREATRSSSKVLSAWVSSSSLASAFRPGDEGIDALGSWRRASAPPFAGYRQARSDSEEPALKTLFEQVRNFLRIQIRYIDGVILEVAEIGEAPPELLDGIGVTQRLASARLSSGSAG